MRGTYAALLATPPNAPLIGWGWPIKTSSSSSMSSVRNSSSIYNDKMNKPSCKQLPSCRRKRGYIWISNPYDFHKERGHIKKKKRTFCIWNDSDLMPIILSDTQRKKFEAGEKSKTAQNLFLTWRFFSFITLSRCVEDFENWKIKTSTGFLSCSRGCIPLSHQVTHGFSLEASQEHLVGVVESNPRLLQGVEVGNLRQYNS